MKRLILFSPEKHFFYLRKCFTFNNYNRQTKSRMSKSSLKNLSHRITEYPVTSALVAIVIVVAGILIDYFCVNYEFAKHAITNVTVKVFSRFLISLGEATFVFILLQKGIEQKFSEEHINHAKNSLESLEKEISATSNTVLTAIKEQSFDSFLGKYYPPQFSQTLINEGFFNFNVLREKTTWLYKIKKINDKEFELIQEIYYDVRNLKDSKTAYPVKLETYKTIENTNRITRINITNNGVSETFENTKLEEKVQDVPTGKSYTKEIVIEPKSKATIEKVVVNTYSEKKIVDFHYPTEHSLNLEIQVQFLTPEEEFDFEIKVPFLTASHEKTTNFGYNKRGHDTRVYHTIPLVLKGQSVMYEVSVK